jgi:hypothetical protein
MTEAELFLCTPLGQRDVGEVKLQLISLLRSALEGAQLSASQPNKSAPSNGRLGGHSASVSATEKTEMFCSCPESKPKSSDP